MMTAGPPARRKVRPSGATTSQTARISRTNQTNKAMMKAFGYISAILTGVCLYAVFTGAKHQILFAAILAVVTALCFWAARHDKKEEETHHA